MRASPDQRERMRSALGLTPIRWRLDGETIRLLRESCGCSQARLAREIGILPSSLCRLERGTLSVSEAAIDEIAEALVRLGADPSALLWSRAN